MSWPKKSKLVLFSLLLTQLHCATGSLDQGGGPNHKTEDMQQFAERRSREVGLLMSNTNRLIEMHGRYKAVRDIHYAADPSGLLSRIRKVNAGYQGWIESWLKLLRELQGGELRTMEESYTRVLTGFAAQEQTQKALLVAVAEAKQMSLRIASELRGIDALDARTFPENAELIKSLRDHIQLLAEHAESLGVGLDRSFQNAVAISAQSRNILDLLFKRAAIAGGMPELERSVARFRDLLAYEAQVEPLLQGIYDAQMKLNSARLAHRAYAAERIYSQGRQRCDQVSAEIGRSTVTEDYKSGARSSAQQACDNLQKKFEGMFTYMPSKLDHLTAFISTKRNTASTDCQKPQPSINCERARRLTALDRATLEAMSDSKRAFVEDELNALFGGQ